MSGGTPDGNYSEQEAQSLDLDQGDRSYDDDAPDDTGISLRSNKLIATEEITAVRNRVRTRTIILVGEHKAGKTTLLAALFGLLCKGPVGDFSFAGSRTLYAFAERSHLALLSSDRESPTTPRTSRADPVGFFHLELANGDDRTHLVVSDRSGEAFEAARINTDLVGNLNELILADRVCFLLDAARLTTIETRADYRRVFKQNIRTLVDNGAIAPTTVIEILVTKIDKLGKGDDGRNLDAEVSAYCTRVLADFSDRDISVHRICALPRADLDHGVVGIDALLARWAEADAFVDTLPEPISDALRYGDRFLGAPDRGN